MVETCLWWIIGYGGNFIVDYCLWWKMYYGGLLFMVETAIV